MILDTKYFKSTREKRNTQKKTVGYYKGKLNGDKKGKPKEAVAVRYYILQTIAYLKSRSPVAQPG